MNGKNIFHPMGFDAFGLPAENYAIKKGIHPAESTEQNIDIMRNQFKAMGVSYDWDYSFNTSDPEYYKWTQWLFLKLYEKGLAYKKKAPVNWCPSCATVLANEQVLNGLCERCSTPVTKRNLNQWFFKITDYSDSLLKGIENLDWPEKTKAMQKNWIGKSEGTEIDFSIETTKEKFTVFTTRPDTIFGVTYIVLAPEHPLLKSIVSNSQKKDVEKYQEKTSHLTEIDRLSTSKEKTGVFTGSYGFNPVNDERIPIWIADYVIHSYGTGAVMAVPAHDDRDFHFAKKYNLPIRQVIQPDSNSPKRSIDKAYTESGIMINSGSFEGMNNNEMIEKINTHLEENHIGGKKVQFRLRDWLVSRQRYWGCPIPIIHCDECGEIPIPENQLPITLPEDVNFESKGESPLSRHDGFMETTCPKCGKIAKREVDTLDTFVCSSWYYLRFPNASNNKVPFDDELTARVLPVDRYCGGPEHACMHLLYARFISFALNDMGLINFKEPFPHLTHQGLILGENGDKMSKSKGNSISPDPYVKKYGTDALRLFLLFGFNFTEGGPWIESGFKATNRFIEKLNKLFSDNIDSMENENQKVQVKSEGDRKLLYRLHNTIKNMTIDTERFMFNTSVARMMELLSGINSYQRNSDNSSLNRPLLAEVLRTFIVLLSPFTPHFSEEWWNRIGKNDSIYRVKWPKYNEEYLKLDNTDYGVMINGKLRGTITVSSQADEEAVFQVATGHENIRKYLDGMSISRKIFIQGKLINIIVEQ